MCTNQVHIQWNLSIAVTLWTAYIDYHRVLRSYILKFMEFGVILWVDFCSHSHASDRVWDTFIPHPWDVTIQLSNLVEPVHMYHTCTHTSEVYTFTAQTSIMIVLQWYSLLDNFTGIYSLYHTWTCTSYSRAPALHVPTSFLSIPLLQPLGTPLYLLKNNTKLGKSQEAGSIYNIILLYSVSSIVWIYYLLMLVWLARPTPLIGWQGSSWPRPHYYMYSCIHCTCTCMSWNNNPFSHLFF